MDGHMDGGNDSGDDGGYSEPELQGSTMSRRRTHQEAKANVDDKSIYTTGDRRDDGAKGSSNE
jgi:hypothetical protein